MKNKTKFKEPDYKKTRELSHRIDCTITESDFDSTTPNPNRIDCAVNDIHRYLKYIGDDVNNVEH